MQLQTIAGLNNRSKRKYFFELLIESDEVYLSIY